MTAKNPLTPSHTMDWVNSTVADLVGHALDFTVDEEVRQIARNGIVGMISHHRRVDAVKNMVQKAMLGILRSERVVAELVFEFVASFEKGFEKSLIFELLFLREYAERARGRLVRLSGSVPLKMDELERCLEVGNLENLRGVGMEVYCWERLKQCVLSGGRNSGEAFHLLQAYDRLPFRLEELQELLAEDGEIGRAIVNSLGGGEYFEGVREVILGMRGGGFMGEGQKCVPTAVTRRVGDFLWERRQEKIMGFFEGRGHVVKGLVLEGLVGDWRGVEYTRHAMEWDGETLTHERALVDSGDVRNLVLEMVFFAGLRGRPLWRGVKFLERGYRHFQREEIRRVLARLGGRASRMDELYRGLLLRILPDFLREGGGEELVDLLMVLLVDVPTPKQTSSSSRRARSILFDEPPSSPTPSTPSISPQIPSINPTILLRLLSSVAQLPHAIVPLLQAYAHCLTTSNLEPLLNSLSTRSPPSVIQAFAPFMTPETAQEHLLSLTTSMCQDDHRSLLPITTAITTIIQLHPPPPPLAHQLTKTTAAGLKSVKRHRACRAVLHALIPSCTDPSLLAICQSEGAPLDSTQDATKQWTKIRAPPKK